MCNVIHQTDAAHEPGISAGATFTGTRAAIIELARNWHRLDAVGEFDLHETELRVCAYDELPTRRPFDFAGAPAHAKLDHPWAPQVPVAGRLQAELLVRGLPVRIEPMHWMGTCGANLPVVGARPVVAVDPTLPGQAAMSVPPGTVLGSRVAVVDSGDLHGPQMVDFLGGLARTRAADDVVGHGTAMSDVIRLLHPKATVTPLRVVNANRGTSYELMCAMTYALWSGMFDVINVSLSSQPAGGCASVLGDSLDMALRICATNGVAPPVIVAAAGNTTTGQSFGYPARMPTATVVLGWNRHRQAATYNVTVPPSVAPVYATGGDHSGSLGTISYPGGQAEAMYGTSYAAAVATALLMA